MSNQLDWQLFLKEYATARGETDWPGNPEASEEQIVKVEQRLKVPLPPSYRAFLKASNGWRNACDSVPVLRPVEKIKWFRKENREWVDAYVAPQQGIDSPISDVDYFSYTAEGSAKFDVKHLAQTLCISDEEDSAVLLLNSMVVWPDGEWEAWFFANWIPGAIRYRSFAEWMQQELTKKLRDTPPEPTPSDEFPIVYRDAPGKEVRRIVQREEIPPLPVVLKNLSSTKEKVQVKAVKQLSRIGGTEAINALIGALKNGSTRDVRCEAAEGLGRLRAREGLDALISAIDDPWVNTTAIHTLGNIDDERAAQCLLKILESGEMYATSAAHPLSVRGDVRAFPHLLRFLVSKEPQHQHIGNIAGRLIASHRDEAACLALEPLMSNPDREIRTRAINGLGDLACMGKDKTTKLKARELLQQCLKTEPNEQLRRHIEVCIKLS